MFKTSFLLFFLAFSVSNLFSQKIDGICSKADLFGVSIDDNLILYHKYNPILSLKQRYSNFDEAKNMTPEELLVSQMSVQNNQWLAFNFDYQINWKEEQFERIKTQDPNSNFVELIRKITYSIENIEYAILRIKVYDDRKQKPATLSLMAKKKKDRWVLVKNSSKSPLEFFMMNLNLKYLDSLFETKATTNNSFNEVLKISWSNEIFSPVSGYKLIGNMMMNENEMLKDVFERENPSISNGLNNQENYTNFPSESVQIKSNYLIPASGQVFCTYFSNELSKFDANSINQLTEHLKNENIDSSGVEPKITPIHEFRYIENGQPLIFIKYSIEKEGSNKEVLIAVLKYEGNKYSKLDGLSDINQQLKTILLKSKSDFIIEISNGEDNLLYPKINNLKSDIKDANGVLNIDKLNQLILNSQSDISEYLD